MGAALGDEGGEGIGDRGGAHFCGGAKSFEREGGVGLGEDGFDAIQGGGRGGLGGRGGAIVVDVQSEAIAASEQVKGEADRRGGGAVLDGEGELVAVAGTPEVQIAISPGVKLGGTAQGLSGSEVSAALSGVVHEHDGGLIATLQGPQEVEQWGDVCGHVFVHAVQTHEGVEHEHRWAQSADGLIKAIAVGLEVEPQAWGGDDLQVEVGESKGAGGADALESLTDDGGSILGGEEKDAAGARHGEAAQAGSGGGDGDGHVQGEEGFAAFGLTADDADGFGGPESLDEPALLGGDQVEQVGGPHGQRGHRRLLVSTRAGREAKTSKKSFSSICLASLATAA